MEIKMKKRKYCVMGIVFLLFCFVSVPIEGRAKESIVGDVIIEDTGDHDRIENMMGEYDLHGIQKQIDTMFPGQNINFLEMLKGVMKGDGRFSIKMLTKTLKESLMSQVGELKTVFLFIVLVGIISALFTNFSNMFENHQIADISYYLLYLFMVIVLLKTFSISLETSKETISNIVLFVKILVPTFYVAIGVSGGVLSATFFYQVIIVIIFGVETILLTFVIPIIYSYVFLAVINGITEDDKFLSMVDLIKKGVSGILNAALVVVTGIGILQSMITPVIDGLKVNAVQKVTSAIPGIGNIADSVTEMVLGSAILIKNSIGVVLFMLLIFICLIPVLKLLLMTIVLKGSSAIMGMVCDKRMAKCAEQVGNGNALLLKTVLTSLSLFLITVAIISMATSRGY